LEITERAVYRRRDSLENRYKIAIRGREGVYKPSIRPQEHPQRISLDIPDGYVVVGSDAHIWPGQKTTAMRGLIKFVKELKPRAVILNGDMVDLPQISRHQPIGWENHPTVQEEIEAAQEQLHEVEAAAGKSEKIWTLGNHDSRYETRLATVAPEYAKIAGVHLKDHFPLWRTCWSSWINDLVVVKHRYRGGDHAPWNNTIRAGKSMVTSHNHAAQVIPYTDYNGTRYGVDTGCLADPEHRAFTDYTEDGPKNWRSGFAVLRFYKGVLLEPQLALVLDKDHIQFRAEVIKV